MNFNDPTIVDQLKAQDHAAFSQLVSSYHAKLVSFARAMIGVALAEEVVQEAWCSAYKALPSFEGRSAIKTWLITIVSNQAKTRLKKEARELSLEELEQHSALDDSAFNSRGHWRTPMKRWHMDSPDKLLEESQLRHCIEYTLSILPPMQNSVFVLRELEHQDLSDICNILQLSDSNVRVLLHRARLKLLNVVARYQETGKC